MGTVVSPSLSRGEISCGGTGGRTGGGTGGGTCGGTGGLFWVLSVFVLPALPIFFFFPRDSSSDDEVSTQGSLSVPQACLVLVMLLSLPWVAIPAD